MYPLREIEGAGIIIGSGLFASQPPSLKLIIKSSGKFSLICTVIASIVEVTCGTILMLAYSEYIIDAKMDNIRKYLIENFRLAFTMSL